MYCVRSAQQGFPKQAQRARASAPPLSGPSFTFRLSPPHFCVTHLYSAGVRCGERTHYIIARHFGDVRDPCLQISQSLIPRTSSPFMHARATQTKVGNLQWLQPTPHVSRDVTGKAGSAHETSITVRSKWNRHVKYTSLQCKIFHKVSWVRVLCSKVSMRQLSNICVYDIKGMPWSTNAYLANILRQGHIGT